MTIFDGRDYKRKACLKFYFHCGPLKISKCIYIKVQNVGNTKAKTDTKCYKKKITQIWRRWGTPQNFLLTFIDELCKTRKIWILKKMKKKKKLLEISFYTCVPKTTIIWGTVTEIWREKQFVVILDHFLPFYPITTQKIKILIKEKSI